MVPLFPLHTHTHTNTHTHTHTHIRQLVAIDHQDLQSTICYGLLLCLFIFVCYLYFSFPICKFVFLFVRLSIPAFCLGSFCFYSFYQMVWSYIYWSAFSLSLLHPLPIFFSVLSVSFLFLFFLHFLPFHVLKG